MSLLNRHIVCYFLATALLIVAETASAYAYAMSLTKFNLDLSKFAENRDPLTPDIPGEDYRGRVSTDFEIRFFDIWFWDNLLHSEGTDGKFETVGWKFRFGLQLTKHVAAFYDHHSRHRMDDHIVDYNFDGRPDRYPAEDSFGVSLKFITSNRPQRSLFE